MPKKTKITKSKTPQYYKFTHCRVEGHHWVLRDDYPKRDHEGFLMFKSDCNRCGAIRMRTFNYKGLTIPTRS